MSTVSSRHNLEVLVETVVPASVAAVRRPTTTPLDRDAASVAHAVRAKARIGPGNRSVERCEPGWDLYLPGRE